MLRYFLSKLHLMRKYISLVGAVFAIWGTIIGCSDKFDDTQIWEKMNSLEGRIAALEQLCRQINTNIASLQNVVDALQEKDYITNISPINEEGKVIGYTMTFSKSGTITIYHGKDGNTPSIDVKKDGDNIYYWTLNGEWLLNEEGHKIKAEGLDGSNGLNGITPDFKMENNYWYVSYDKGDTWTKLGKATGEDGKTPSIGVKKDGDSIYYWTLNGEWLLDEQGYKIKAEGIDGNNGDNSIIPKLKIENNDWYVSYDNGTTWKKLGRATGKDGEHGDSMFSQITYDEEYVFL